MDVNEAGEVADALVPAAGGVVMLAGVLWMSMALAAVTVMPPLWACMLTLPLAA